MVLLFPVILRELLEMMNGHLPEFGSRPTFCEVLLKEVRSLIFLLSMMEFCQSVNTKEGNTFVLSLPCGWGHVLLLEDCSLCKYYK